MHVVSRAVNNGDGKMAMRPGRPAKPEDQRRSRNLTFRVRGDLHERLQTAAAGERSISEEIERRLEQSFWYDDAVGSADMAQLAREATICASSIKRHATDDKRVREVLHAALAELFCPTDHRH